MNQHYDANGDEKFEDFEKKLAAIDLLAPSDQYREIPGRIKTKTTANSKDLWRWLATGTIACLVVALGLIEFYRAKTTSPTPAIAIERSEPQLKDVELVASNIQNDSQYSAGNHYIELRNPIELSDSTSTQVIAFFWYPCWPCSDFEDYLANWEGPAGEDIVLTRVPAIWSPAMRFHARAFYTAQVLGVLEETHRQFYTAFKKDSPSINNEEDLQQFFENIDVSPSEFFTAYHSPATLELLEYAESQNFAYQAQSAPSMFIDGKYGISPKGAGGFSEMLEVADFLIQEM